VLDLAVRLVVEAMTRQQLALVELEAQHRGAARRILVAPLQIATSRRATSRADVSGPGGS
jgi:hypothetical protein